MNYCKNCGLEIPVYANFCAKCGAPKMQEVNEINNYSHSMYSQNYQSTNPLCVAGITIGIGEIFTSLTMMLFSIIGLTLSIIGLIRCKKLNQKGSGLGIAGIVINSIILFYWIIILLL